MFPFPLVLAFFLGYAFGAGTAIWFAQDLFATTVASVIVVVTVVNAVALPCTPSVAYRVAWWGLISLAAAAGTRIGQGPIRNI